MYYYKAYQLNIRASFPIPEFPLSGETDTPDVIIREGAVPESLEHVTSKGVVYQATENQFLLTMHDIARYLVQNGNEIVVEPLQGSLPSDVRVFLLGSCLGALLHQRGMLVIHAGAIKTDKGAALFSGPSGIGKSTLLGEFLRRGYKMMVDDVCGVILDTEQKPVVLPGYPRTRLWTDSAHKLEQDISNMQRTRPDMEKYERQLPEQYWDQPAPLHRIYMLNPVNRDEIKLMQVKRLNTFNFVLKNTYRQQFLDGLAMRAPHFTLVSAVAKHTTVVRALRPSGQFKLVELADMIEQDFGQD